MFDYSNLDDHEFEVLGSEMMGRILNKELRYFPKGRDGGVDLVDDVNKMNVLIQVKHYIKTPYSGFKNSLEKELIKINDMKIKPKEYFIFTSMSMTPDNIRQIYFMFKEYMPSEKNIITRENINQFLKKEENLDILRGNFKLWITSDTILKDILNQKIFLDSEVLKSDIYVELKSFVQTDVFNKCIRILENERKLFLYGDPGVGKTINSRMLILHFAKQGYVVRYSDSGDIGSIKKSMTQNKELKEVIFIDDCLGQHYFKLEQGQNRELLSLMKHVDLYKNKIIILNSRVTILNEAKNTFVEFDNYFSSEKITMQKINLNKISNLEKAKIFYGILKRNKLTNDYYNYIRKDSNYLKIIQHNNYNPRIIEHISLSSRVKKNEKENYFSYINQNLNNPQNIWKDEFNKRLSKYDRKFMHILYSLTDRFIEKETLKNSFNYSIEKDENIDTTTNHFEDCILRLNQSIIRSVDIGGKEMIGVTNPSVNDYLRETILSNDNAIKNLKSNAIYLDQLEKVSTFLGFKEELRELIFNKELNEFSTLEKRNLFDLKIHLIAEYKIEDEDYLEDIKELIYIKDFMRIGVYSKDKSDTIRLFLTSTKLFNYYNIEELISNVDKLERMLEEIDFGEVIPLFDEIIKNLKKDYNYQNIYNHLTNLILQKLSYYIEEYDYGSLIDDLEDSDITFMKEIVKEDFENIIEVVQDKGFKNELKKDFLHFEREIENYIESNLDYIENNFDSEKEESTKESISIHDILNRPI